MAILNITTTKAEGKCLCGNDAIHTFTATHVYDNDTSYCKECMTYVINANWRYDEIYLNGDRVA